MKDVFLVYDRCCFYEIVILSYFLNYSHCDLVFCSPDGKPVRAMEGFSVHVDASLEDLDKAQIRSFIVPGGAVSGIDTAEVKVLLRNLKQRGALIDGICAGVDVLDHAGILHDVKSTHASDDDWVCDKQVATARRMHMSILHWQLQRNWGSLQAKRICGKPSASGNITNGFNKTGGTNHEKLYEYASGSGGCLRYCIDAAVRQLCAAGGGHRLAEGISDRTVINLRQRSGYTL